MYSQKYLSDILVRLAHHSTALEGNTISLPETVVIILESSLPGSHKSIREFYEIDNHKQAFRLLLDALDDQAPLSLSLILSLHAALTDRLQADSGHFKSTDNAIIGATFQTAPPGQVPYLVQQWVDNTSHRLANAHSEADILHILADSHIHFERIHPFSDGNGRTGRLLLLFLSMRDLPAPVIISKEDRGAYIEALADQDVQALAALMAEKLQEEKARRQTFA
ncbi:Fic family protein [Peptococcus simiae]|uniref:Fic family protein n=1 Tax=Peptococcus simiae TaxID=1643805 RepID=A0ABW9GXX6_9FIRM